MKLENESFDFKKAVKGCQFFSRKGTSVNSNPSAEAWARPPLAGQPGRGLGKGGPGRLPGRGAGKPRPSGNEPPVAEAGGGAASAGGISPVENGTGGRITKRRPRPGGGSKAVTAGAGPRSAAQDGEHRRPPAAAPAPARPAPPDLVLELQRGLLAHGLVEALLAAGRQREGEVAVQGGAELGGGAGPRREQREDTEQQQQQQEHRRPRPRRHAGGARAARSGAEPAPRAAPPISATVAPPSARPQCTAAGSGDAHAP